MTAINHHELTEDRKIWPALGLFMIFLIVFSFVIDLALYEFGLRRYYIAALMWMPGLSALLSLKILNIPIEVIGWRWGKARFQIACYLLPALYGLIAYGFIWASGLGGFPSSSYIDEARLFLGLSGWSDLGVLMLSVIVFASVGLLWHLITALGEEIGWRGLLTPFLMRKLTFVQTSLVTGIVWALWHTPLIFFAGYNAGPRGLDFQMLNFAVLMIALSFPMTYYRIKSMSVWAPTMIHAAHNVFVLSLYHPMTIKNEDTLSYAGEFGVVLPIVLVGVAVYYWRLAMRDDIKGKIGANGIQNDI